jgi:hypothetical protein
MNAIGGGTFLGYAAGIETATIIGNTFVGGPNVIPFDNIRNVTFTGNKIYGPTNGSPVYVNKRTSTTGLNWNNNTYYNRLGSEVYVVEGSGFLNFGTWKSTTGFDTSSTQVIGPMPDTATVIPNIYETGRANIVVVASSNPTSINVDLSTTGLVHGQSYTVRNAFNYKGTAVATGVYSSSSPTINLSLTGAARSVATPTGMTYTPATTVPEFGVFIVVPSS